MRPMAEAQTALARSRGFDTYYVTRHGFRDIVLLGEDIGVIPEGFYPGDYLKDVGTALAARDGNAWVGQPEAAWLAPVRCSSMPAAAWWAS